MKQGTITTLGVAALGAAAVSVAGSATAHAATSPDLGGLTGSVTKGLHTTHLGTATLKTLKGTRTTTKDNPAGTLLGGLPVRQLPTGALPSGNVTGGGLLG